MQVTGAPAAKYGEVFAAAVSKGKGGATIHEKNAQLNAMVDTCKERSSLFRTSTDNLDDARRLYPNLTALVVFPNYEPSEVMALARDRRPVARPDTAS